ncbi:MAG: hypothetical protein AB1505_13905, partial [Candidatus Latescibacterota bacterium]
DTTFTDSTARHQVDYLYTVVVEAAGEALESEAREGRLVLPAVAIVRLEMDSRTATAGLEWESYRGPRFRAYEVRRSAGSAAPTLAHLEDPAQTAFVDSGLIGNTRYAYAVTVLTQAAEEVASAAREGIIHELLATWPLELDVGAGFDEYVRLYAEPGDSVAALVFDAGAPPPVKGHLRLLHYDGQGRVLGDHRPIEALLAWDDRTAAQALTPSGERFLHLVAHREAYWTRSTNTSTSTSTSASLLLAFDGMSVQRLEVLVPGVLGPSLQIPLEAMPDRVTVLWGEWLDNLEIGRDRDIRTERFDRAGAAAGEDYVAFAGVPGLEFTGHVFDGWLWWAQAGTGYRLSLPLGGAGQATSLWAATDLLFYNYPASRFGLQLGGMPSTRTPLVSLVVDPAAGKFELSWRSVSADGDLRIILSDTLTATLPFPVVNGLPYRLELGCEQGEVRASVQGWAIVSQKSLPLQGAHWSALAPVGDLLALTLDGEAYAVVPGEDPTFLTALGSYVGELRSRQVPGERFQRLAACFPVEDQVYSGRVLRAARWDLALGPDYAIGPHLGEAGGSLYYPLSCDIAPDGRLYVLDAGNHRIVAFDKEGNYVTQWGSQGSGEEAISGGQRPSAASPIGPVPGAAQREFDFGPGSSRPPGQEFAGSVCVDSQGYIYVADAFNQRIQKFAP